MKIKKVKDLRIGATYKAYNYDVTFDMMYITPIKVDGNVVTFENSARRSFKVDFDEKKSWFGFMNLHEV